MGSEIETHALRASRQAARNSRRQIAITSAAVPPSGSGQAAVLGQMLAGRDSKDVILRSDFSFYLRR